MCDFRKLDIKNEYRTLLGDIIGDFYQPVLSCSKSYDRAVGFFSSSILAKIAEGVYNLAENKGRIRIIASPHLSEADIEAIARGYEERDKIVEGALMRQLKSPVSESEKTHLNLLSNLIADGILDIKIALTENETGVGMYHEKMAIFEDFEGNQIAFSGSMNESLTATEINYEAIDVFCSWKGEQKRIDGKKQAFERIWNNREKKVVTKEFLQVKQELITRYLTEKVNYAMLSSEHKEAIGQLKYKNEPHRPAFLELRDYQKAAIRQWELNNYRGIFVMATGTGKTYTGLAAAETLYKNVKGRLAMIVVCPYQHLVEQWVEDLQAFGIRPIIGYSASSQRDYMKRLSNAVMDYNLGANHYFCFICTNGTFVTEKVQKLIKEIKGNSFLLVDEAHNFGASKLKNTLDVDYDYRLALSATFERHNDLEGTEALKNFFGEICIDYPIEIAIKNHMLTPYYYYPVITILTEGELEKYKELTKKLVAFMTRDKQGKQVLNDAGKKIALERARLVAAAKDKERALLDYIEDYREEHNLLVYCGSANIFDDDDGETSDIRQIDEITRLLGKTLGMRVAQFTAKESADERKMLIEQFSTGEDLQGLIAIKCLDEGVNIPSIKTAFILASTTNPKEYIQRRGRVLRLYEGKKYATIYDFISLPRALSEISYIPQSTLNGDLGLVKNELRRMIEFKRISMNPYDSDFIINELIEGYKLYDFLNEDEEKEVEMYV